MLPTSGLKPSVLAPQFQPTSEEELSDAEAPEER